MNLTRAITRAITQPLSRSITSPPIGGGGALAVPSGFGWTPPVNVYKSGSTYSTDYDPTPFLVEGDPGVTTYYVDSATGSEANPGTAALPKKSLRNITASRTTKLLIKARGTFYYAVTGPIFMSHDTLCVEAWGGASCVLTMEADPASPFVWTDEGGGVWSAPSVNAGTDRIAAYSGTDIESLVYYPVAASLAACQATPGTIFRTTGPIKHYVHTLTGASPASGHTVFGANGNAGSFLVGSYAYDQACQFIGVDFRGGDAAFAVTDASIYTKRIDFVNCSFKYADTFAALHGTGSTTIVTYQCTAGPSRYDGFAYTAAGGQVPKALEIENVGRNCGHTSSANQGSTTHQGGKVVRVGGQYYENANDQVCDVNASTRSWNLGVTVGPKGIGSGFSGFSVGNDGDPAMYLDGCTFVGLDNEVHTTAASAVIYYRNMPAPVAKTGSTGTITTY